MKTETTAVTPYINCPSEKEFDAKLNLIRDTLKQYGCCVIHPWDRETQTLHTVSSIFGRIQSHTGSDEDKLTHNATVPHTEGIFLDGFKINGNALVSIGPPKVILLQNIGSPAEKTQHVIIDSQKILKDLLEHEPKIAQVLLQSGAIVFCGNDAFEKSHPVYEKRLDGRFHVRFRYDSTAYSPAWAVEIINHLHHKYHMNPKYRIKLELEPGQILVIDNLRCLHSQEYATTPEMLKKIWINDEQTTLLENIAGKATPHDALEPYKKYGVDESRHSTLKPIIIKTGISLPYRLLSLAEQLAQRRPAYAVNYFLGEHFFRSELFNSSL